jgi:transcriptional regulator with XRE-family HTH domain
MDDVRVGSIIRAVRIRRRLRQSDVADAACVSRALVSIVERGGLEELSLRSIRRVAAAVGVRLQFDPRWRGAELVKLLDERHAAIVAQVVRRLIDVGWTATAEVTFAFGRESGAVDVLGWRADSRAMLLVEVKSEIADLQDLLATFDRKRRLASAIARDRNLRPLLIGSVIGLPEETQARNAVERNRQILDQTYPARTLQVRRWLRQPERDIRGIWFLPIGNTVGAKRRAGGSKRVRRRREPDARTTPSVRARDLAGESHA